MRRLLALDLSLSETGWALFTAPMKDNGYLNDDEFGWVSGVLTAPKGLREGVRLLWFWRQIQLLLGGSAGDLAPGSVVIEDIPMHAKSAGLTAQLHGTIKAFAAESQWPVPLLVPPATVKVMATGKGNADKTAMVIAARDRLGYEGQNNNVADALWLGQIGLHLAGHEAAVKLPLSHLRALDKLRP